MIEKYIEGNRRFLEEDYSKNEDFYQSIVHGQSPGVLWIGCSDSRINPERITGAGAGELFVHRNIGNIVAVGDLNFATVLEYAVKHLKIGDIVVCGHSDCGAIKALDHISGDDTYIPEWLGNAMEAKTRVDGKIDEPTTDAERKERLRQIELENIRLQIEHLRDYEIVTRAEESGSVTIHGLYFDLETGNLKKIC